ncbi:MAG: hypothetical protein ABI614_10770 [Planctomycetota bacterium]
MRFSKLLSGMLAALLVFVATGRGEEQAAKVAEYGNPANWQISGVEAFDPQDVKRSLSWDFDVQLAAHQQAPLAALPTIMRERLLEGYRSVGFADAQVNTSLDEQRQQVSIHVVEGRRYQSGRVRVVGVDDDLAEQLRLALTTEQLPATAVTPVFDDSGEPLHWRDQSGDEVDMDKPLWVEGKPAAFNESVRDSITRRLARSLGELGYVEPKFAHELTKTDTTADLLVRIEEFGAVAVLREIAIAGNERNTRDEIIEYLKLRIGDRFASAEKRRVLLALRASARFIEQQTETEPIDATGGTKLTIKLKELSAAPRLSEPFTREDLALLKMHHWLTQGEGRSLDSVVRLKTETQTWECVISPQSGVIVTLRMRSAQDTSRSVAHLFIASQQEVGLYNLRDQRCLILPPGTVGLELTTHLKISGMREKPFMFGFGFGVFSQNEERSRPSIELKTAMEPVYFLGLARLRNSVYAWDGDYLTVQTDRGTLTVDSRSGRLLERTFEDEAYGTVQYEYREGAFDEAVAQLRASTAEFRNEYDANRPVSSTLKYGCSLVELYAALMPDTKALQRFADPSVVAAAGNLLDHGLLNGIDREWISRDEPEDNDDFSIPPSQPIGLTPDGIGRVAVAVTDELFLRDTWPANLLRESGFVLAGHREYTKSELDRLVRDVSFGPIGHWLLAELVTDVSPRTAIVVANLGSEHLSREACERDIALLTANCAEHLSMPVRAVCSLSDEEVATLGRLALDDPGHLVRAVQLLRQSKVDELHATLLRALGQLWDDELRQRVSERLLWISLDRLPRVANEPPKKLE